MKHVTHCLVPAHKMVCLAFRDEAEGEEIEDYLVGLTGRGGRGAAWNMLLDLRLFLGSLSSISIERLSRMLPPPGAGENGTRLAIISQTSGMRFLVNLARIFFQGHELRLFADMDAGYQWAALGDAGADAALIMPGALVDPYWGRRRLAGGDGRWRDAI